MLCIINNNVFITKCFNLHESKSNLNSSVKYCVYESWDTVE